MDSVEAKRLRDKFLALSKTSKGIGSVLCTRIAIDLDHFARVKRDEELPGEETSEWVLVKKIKERPKE